MEHSASSLGSRLSRRWWIYRAQVTLDADGIGVASATGSSRPNWPAITRLNETPDYFVLIGPSLAAVSLTKRAMTAEQAGQFRALVSRHSPHALT